MMRRIQAPAVLGAVALLLTTGCSFSIGSGDKGVTKEKVAERIMVVLEEQVGRAPDKVTCPDDLKAEVGATLRCTLYAGSDSLGIDVVVTEVKDDDVKYHIQVDEVAPTADATS